MAYYYPHYYLNTERKPYETLPINTTEQLLCGKNGEKRVFELHNHESLELNAVVRGNFNITLDGTKYTLKPGEVLLANPYSLHSGEWEEDCSDGKYITLIVPLSKFLIWKDSPLTGTLLAVKDGKASFDCFFAAGNPVYSCVLDLHKLYHEKSAANDARCLGQLFDLLGLLTESHFHPEPVRASNRLDAAFLRSVCTYISEHYAEDISTQKAAAAFFMDTSHFCRKFQRHFGVGFSKHLCRFRVLQAAQFCRGSGMSMSDVARKVGFNNYGYFSRSFKQYIGESPAYYFSKWENPGKKE